MSGMLSTENEVFERALGRAIDRVTIGSLADLVCSVLKSRGPNQSINDLAKQEKSFFIHIGKLCQSALAVNGQMQVVLDEQSPAWLTFETVQDGKIRSVCSIGQDEPIFSISDSISSRLNFRWNNRYNEIAKSIVDICVSKGFERDVAESFLIYSGSAVKIRSAWRAQLDVKAMMEAVGRFYQTLDREIVGLAGRFCKRISVESYLHVKRNQARYQLAVTEGGALAALPLAADRIGLPNSVMEGWLAGLSDSMKSALKDKSSRYLYWPIVQLANSSVMIHSAEEDDDRVDQVFKVLSLAKTTYDQCDVLPAESLLIKAAFERGVGDEVLQPWLCQVTKLHQAAPRRYPIELLRRSMDILKNVGLVDPTPYVIRRQIEEVCEQHGASSLRDQDDWDDGAPARLLTKVDPDHPEYCILEIESGRLGAFDEEINEILRKRPFQVFRHINDECSMSAYLSTRAGARQVGKNGKVRQAFCESSLKMALEARHEKSFLSILEKTPSPFKALQSIDPVDIFRAGREGCLERALSCAPLPMSWLSHVIRTEDAVAMSAIVSSHARLAEPMDFTIHHEYEKSTLCSAQNTAFMNAALLESKVQEKIAKQKDRPVKIINRMHSI